ncbi:hypothetical protein BDU57DRAFT_511477 [Ampelomyces quisqualis]|uniref:Secreted protein n=1 Tax=Ampelomyces quisqualis TaxID=50730 RepID=A0A6A5QTM6_AMPQU|nr:hypothetical protein BDU57DRAFT_511477 [Ampelomyces quisqualis]
MYPRPTMVRALLVICIRVYLSPQCSVGKKATISQTWSAMIRKVDMMKNLQFITSIYNGLWPPFPFKAYAGSRSGVGFVGRTGEIDGINPGDCSCI